MTRIGPRALMLLLVGLFASGAARAGRGPRRDRRLVALDQVRAAVRVPSLRALSDAGGAGDLGGLDEGPATARYRAAEAAARQAALAVARQVHAAGREDARKRAAWLARRNAATRAGWAPGKRRGRFKAGRARAARAQKKRLWRHAMEEAFARYRVLEQEAYAAARELVRSGVSPGEPGRERIEEELVVEGEGARREEAGAPSWEDSLAAEGFAPEGYRAPRARFSPAPLDPGSAGSVFGLAGE